MNKREGGEKLETLADKMLDYRAKHDLSQGELADLCHVTKQTIWAIENKAQRPTKLTERKILNIVED